MEAKIGKTRYHIAFAIMEQNGIHVRNFSVQIML